LIEWFKLFRLKLFETHLKLLIFSPSILHSKYFYCFFYRKDGDLNTGSIRNRESLECYWVISCECTNPQGYSSSDVATVKTIQKIVKDISIDFFIFFDVIFSPLTKYCKSTFDTIYRFPWVTHLKCWVFIAITWGIYY